MASVTSLLLLGSLAACGTDAGGSGSVGAGETPLAIDIGLAVSGRDLYDRCGEQVVLRGVNEMIAWSGGRDGVPEFAEIAKTGANAVRIVWTNEGSANALDIAIKNALAQKLIPMIENHGATGNLAAVPAVVDYWTLPDVVAVLEKHERNVLLNIANEAGDKEPAADFESTYRTAISRIREAGLAMPLVIDASQWGQDINMLQAVGPSLIEHDPEHNLLLSVHMWWSDASGARVVSELQESVDLGLPLIVGEFAQHAVYQCDKAPFAYSVLLAEAQKHRIGWLAWSWGSVTNEDCASEGSFDMTERGVYGQWNEPWAEAVAVTDANSIQNTSVRPASLVSGSCASEP